MPKLPKFDFIKAWSMASGVVLIFGVGLVFGYFKWQPSPLIGFAVGVAKDLNQNVKAYFGDTPSQHLRPNRFGYGGVTVPHPDQVSLGVTFVTGLFGEKLGARLYAKDGTLLKEWPIDFFEIAPDGMAYNFDALIHGDHLYENGDFLANLDGRGLVRVSACGDIVWQNRELNHHSIDIDDNGDIWTPINGSRYDEDRLYSADFNFDRLGRFDAATGVTLEEIDLVDALMSADLMGLALTNSVLTGDMMHLNDLEILSARMASAFPMFKAGDILLSSRHYNQIWVLDRETKAIKWRYAGPMVGQHDPDFQLDGTITVFDNQTGSAIGRGAEESTADDVEINNPRNGSRILSVDPNNNSYRVVYASDERNDFYSPYRGKHQQLENGNILITETDAGRVFEISPEGDIVWSFVNEWDEQSVGWVMQATRYPDSYASIADISCTK